MKASLHATLDVHHLVSGIGATKIIKDVSLSAESGSIVALIGPNGSGKTSVMRAISGLNPTWGGSITLNGAAIDALPPYDRVAAGLVMVPPGFKLFLGLSIEANLTLGAFLCRSQALIRERLDQVYDLFPELVDRRKQIVGSLSGGQKQMCAVARGLMAAPNIMLLDELSNGLAPIVVERLLDRLRAIREDTDVGMIIVEQDIQVALDLANHVYVLADGRNIFDGPPERVEKDTRMQELFVGKL